MRSIEEIEAFITQALDPSFRGQLVARGEARAIIRRNGDLPSDAPNFASSIEADLADYGFSVLDAALELRSLDRSNLLAKQAFRASGSIFETLTKNGDATLVNRGFLRVISATSHHLAGYAAVAFSLFPSFQDADLNLNPAEKCLVMLILRDLEEVRNISRIWLEEPSHQDQEMAQQLVDPDIDRNDVLSSAVISGLMRGLSHFEFALQTGEASLIEQAQKLLDATYGLAGETGQVSLWWILRLTRGLIADLWVDTLHQVIPLQPVTGESELYEKNRTIFIAALFSQSTSQVELWPSQIAAARRAADPNDDLVVALPTSAGKTRIAELATLTCLSQGKRVLIVTPLRALSAQTERSFRSAFIPLGARVSSLYGASGFSSGDASALENDGIVVATPEKLDFALRSDPHIIDDIGLIVLDEGHLIGPSSREILFEILVQRLLRRQDADQRRIVCLSAILPEGEELEDMTAWIRSDDEGDPVRSEWRPTKQRFGTLEWRNDRATLRYDLSNDGPYVSSFLTQIPAIHPDRLPRPTDLQGITLMGAWRFASEGKRTLIFVTQANWVEGFAKQALNFVDKGYFEGLDVDPAAIKGAVTIGEEWLGADHPAVACLKIGMAVHHGGLPSPFLREVERVLASGAIQVTAASPTLTQGLNINAAVLLTPYIVRSGEAISGEEFANVAGRAGRAFVDTEGLILHVMLDNHDYRRQQWKALVQNVHVRTLRSGLSQIISLVVRKMNAREIVRTQTGYEFLANSREGWLVEPEEAVGVPIDDLVARLDAIIFGLVEALESDSENLPTLLDEALEGSLWDRRMSRQTPGVRRMQLIVLKTRARLIWSSTTPIQRKGYFSMGVGLDTGLRLDELSGNLEAQLDLADMAALLGDLTGLHSALVTLAESLLTMKPFISEAAELLPDGWEATLKQWLAGEPISAIGSDKVKLIEDAFVYRLVWAIEAIRTRRIAHGWDGGEVANAGMAATCLDTGMPDFRMSMMVRAGLPSRSAAKFIIEEMTPEFIDARGMRRWLHSNDVKEKSENQNWPSEDTASLWQRFRNQMIYDTERSWSLDKKAIEVEMGNPITGVFRVDTERLDGPYALSADFKKIGRIRSEVLLQDKGVQYGRKLEDGTFELISIGPVE
ncbi:MAG: DEAD/DEAH box helicase [Paracoccaceae bacterium]